MSVKDALSNHDLQAFFNKYNILSLVLRYDELSQYQNLHSLFYPNNSRGLDVIVLLYEIEPGYGHWCGLIKRPGQILEFFDSYGLKPDDERSFLPKNAMKHSYLSDLLYYENLHYGTQIDYNERQYQNMKNHSISTCGKWVACRTFLRAWNLEKFAKMFYLKTPNERDSLVNQYFQFLISM